MWWTWWHAGECRDDDDDDDGDDDDGDDHGHDVDGSQLEKFDIFAAGGKGRGEEEKT